MADNMPVIAIDGPAASGKGTLAKRLAEQLGFAYLDSGSLYRAVALTLLEAGVDLNDQQAAEKAARTLDLAITQKPALRSAETGAAASIVAAMPQVRAALLEFQRIFAQKPPQNAKGAVLDGRDIGTVVCPKAACKLFVTANDEVRAQRRFDELTAKGADVTYAQILRELRDRDERDMNRATAPLSQAADATLLDTSELDIEGAFQRALDIVSARLRGLGISLP
ncbi:MAG: (d)CMP kinase [Alphaproteobacteria bacterium]